MMISHYQSNIPLNGKLLWRLILKRLLFTLHHRAIQYHQFGLWKTVQMCPIYDVYAIITSIRVGKNCLETILDVTQTFDRVWHLPLRVEVQVSIHLNNYHIIQVSYRLIRPTTPQASPQKLQGRGQWPVLYTLFTQLKFPPHSETIQVPTLIEQRTSIVT